MENSLRDMDEEEPGYETYRKMIDEDFKRFIRLEKAWIAQISQKIMPSGRYFVHEDRAKLRNKLNAYLKKKMKGVEFEFDDKNP